MKNTIGIIKRCRLEQVRTTISWLIDINGEKTERECQLINLISIRKKIGIWCWEKKRWKCLCLQANWWTWNEICSNNAFNVCQIIIAGGEKKSWMKKRNFCGLLVSVQPLCHNHNHFFFSLENLFLHNIKKHLFFEVSCVLSRCCYIHYFYYYYFIPVQRKIHR